MTQEQELISKAQNSQAPKDVVLAFLANTAKENVKHAAEILVHENATYISLNFDNKELEQIEPWTGTRQGRQIYINTFSNVGTYWDVNEFKITDVVGENEIVAVFGSFTYTSVEVGHRFTSPFSILAKVKDGQIVFFQFMEDTYASARSFRKSGSWNIQNNHRQITVGDE
ncbi:nuclear transport factor 2 family protein [Acinetobacter shaoyimingii]|uniref:Nuclear transport factor 2 family protein n=1 Tax=Acinetobacter shaoyimingii TaxID=2715164 RepID=A0A6G8RVW8_9GAMM|nr:nuclear transport factor 2 family protein [Acinetobacter shaoyimingii]QIO05980.1 nuclear transport factor 2 family protein [Acinetobacter shaoyimingii]